MALHKEFTRTFEIEGANGSRQAAALTVLAALEDDGMLTQSLQVVKVTDAVVVINARYVLPVRCGGFHSPDPDEPCEALMVEGEWWPYCPVERDNYAG